jgi:hypothetical protein
MKRLAALLIVVSASVVLLAEAAAAVRLPHSPFKLLQLGLAAADPYKIPPEWDGIWTSTDSTYDCAGGLQQVAVGEDTLCSGAVFLDPVNFTGPAECTGSITATTINITCTGDTMVVPDCVATLAYSIQGTRAGDDAYQVATISVSYDGSAPECGFFPDYCFQVNAHAHRTGPAPPTYCATPTLPSTWGGVKIRYR